MVVEFAKDGNDYGEHIFQEEGGTSRGVQEWSKMHKG